MQTQRVVIAATDVLNSTRACRIRGDAATFALVSDYYRVVADAIEPVGGRVVKVIGDSVLMIFPAERASDALPALRRARDEAQTLWRAFHDECAVQLRIHAGDVVCGLLGAPGEERFDVIGDTVNTLFKQQGGEFVVTPAVAALL